MNTQEIKKIVTDEEAAVALAAYIKNLEENNGLLLDGYEEVEHIVPVKSKLSKLFGKLVDNFGGVVAAGALGVVYFVATQLI
ncbi:hypothetical protein [Aquitalea pelogenes]|uniref:hypothetical protein n=1 Tax=Aquitalea pelogenes TaxID=1293573 RepID=UPI0035B02990